MRIAPIATAILEGNDDRTVSPRGARRRYVTRAGAPGTGADLFLEVAGRYARPGEPFFSETEVP